MPKLAANLTMLYNEVDFLDRFAAAAKSDFACVEYLFPYPYPKEQLAERLEQHRLKQVLHNLPAGDVGSHNLYLQYDIYHMQRMEGEVANTIRAHLPRIAHMQLADNPGHNEPGTGEINYRFLFAFIDAIGYDGWIGCEYKPRTTTAEGLGWRATHGV